MNLEQQVTSLEISKKLKELGVKQESLYLWSDHTIPATLWLEGNFEIKYKHRSTYPCYSAFTVAELGEMLPEDIKSYKININGNIEYWCSCDSYVSDSNTEANTRGKMLIYLLENNLIK